MSMKYLFKPLTILIIIVLVIVGFNLFILDNKNKNNNGNDNAGQTSSDQDNTNNGNNGSNDFTTTSPKVVYQEEPAYKNAKYFQKITTIKGQLTYFSYPLEINPENPPILIVYSHGSVSFVSTNLNDSFMKELQVYAKQFSNNGYAFIASNEHGTSYGNQDALNDITNSINYIKNNYKMQEKVYMIGYSMGGLPPIYYAFSHTDVISKMALLAPVTYTDDQPSYYKLKDIKIKIWHGDADKNVPQYTTQDFYNYMINTVKSKNIQYIKIPGASHWDLNPQLAPDIYKFFSEK